MPSTQSYQIGNVIYVLSNKSQKILPGIVVEEIHHRRRDGDSVSYKVSIGPQGQQKLVDLSMVDGEVYNTLDEIKAVLIGNFTAMIDDLCAETEQRVAQWYGNQESVVPSSSDKIDPGALLNQVSHQVPQYAPQYIQPQQHTGTSLRSQMTDPDLLQRDVQMPDGSVKKVSVNLNPK